ncbi:MAG: FAD-binding oxidoreductase [Deltaproteobacteria bacterium]|nr:FAD-binding oxidoreductase [Deltaproteobacteria bacterium]
MIKESTVADVKKIVGRENILVSPEDLKAYSYDGTTTWVHQPDLVLFPKNTKEVSEVMKLANREKIPVTPRGGGTNVSGGSIPIMVVSFSVSPK